MSTFSSKTKGMKAQAQTLSFMHSFRPVYFVLRTFGLMPFTIIHHPNGEVLQTTVTKFDALWLMTSVISYSLMAFFMKVRDTPRFFLPILHMLAKFGWIYIVLVIWINMCTRFEFTEIFRKITIFDREASNLINHLAAYYLFAQFFRTQFM